MPAQITPRSYFEDYTYNPSTGDVTFPLYALNGLEEDEANTTSGDIRKIMLSFVDVVYRKLLAIPVADRPTKFSITKSTPSGINPNVIRQAYTISFDLDTSKTDLTNE